MKPRLLYVVLPYMTTYGRYGRCNYLVAGAYLFGAKLSMTVSEQRLLEQAEKGSP
jgi:hypothetical protein